MTAPVFYHGFPIAFGWQFRSANDAGSPIDISNYLGIQFLTKHAEGLVVAMDTQVVDAASGAVSSVIADSRNMRLGLYEVEANYADGAGVAQPSTIEKFVLVRTLKGELLKQEAAHV